MSEETPATGTGQRAARSQSQLFRIGMTFQGDVGGGFLAFAVNEELNALRDRSSEMSVFFMAAAPSGVKRESLDVVFPFFACQNG